MRRIREVLRLKFELRLSDAQVARGAGIARSTAQDYLRRIRETGLGYEQLTLLDDTALDQRLFPPQERRNIARPLPDWEAVERELRGRGVTLRLLWLEYLETHPDGYQYTHYVAAKLMLRGLGNRSERYENWISLTQHNLAPRLAGFHPNEARHAPKQLLN